jgi:ketosteroid isomerase-like protein
MLAFLDPAMELHEEPDLPGAQVWHGREGFASYFSEAGARWSELSVELHQVSELNESTVLVGGRLHGTGSISGASVDTEFWHVLELREERAVRMLMFFEREQALAAAGPARADVDIVRRIFDGFGRGDFASAVALYDPEVEWIENRGIPGHGAYRGLDGVREGFLEWLTAWDGYRCEAQELTLAGDRVVAMVRGSGRGKLSGVDATDLFFQVWTIRDGKVARIENHRERDEAMDAAGRERASGASR